MLLINGFGNGFFEIREDRRVSSVRVKWGRGKVFCIYGN